MIALVRRSVHAVASRTRGPFLMAGALMLGICLYIAPASAASDGPGGVWLTQNGDARIQVAKCGSALCGKVVGLKSPLDPNTGRPATDGKNTNPALRSRPIVGLALFNGMRQVSENKWSGRIYNAEDGKFYDSSVTYTAPASLNVEGCVAMFCGGENWTRAGR